MRGLKNPLLRLCIASWLLVWPLDSAGSDDDDVIILTSDNFQRQIEGHKYMLVEFYSAGCNHCEAFAPKYASAATTLMEVMGVPVARIDGTDAPVLLQKYSIKSFPTLCWFEGDAESYLSPEVELNTTDDIVQWALFMATSPVEVVEAEDLDETGFAPDVVLYAESLLDSFESAARLNRHSARWRHVIGDGTPTVSIRHWREDPIQLAGSALARKKGVAEFFEEHRFANVGMIGRTTREAYLASGQGIVLVFVELGAGGIEAFDHQYRHILSKIAQEFTGKHLVAYADPQEFNDTLRDLDIINLPAVAVQMKFGAMQYFVHRGEVTSDLSRFITLVHEGKITATSKSQPKPRIQKGPIREVVGRTLQREVFVPDKDVILLVYAPWCDHCKRIEPEYTKLAKQIKSLGLSKYVKLVRMDGTANGSPISSISWEGFPTVYLCKAGMEAAQMYGGSMDANGLWEFIVQEGANMYEIQDHLEHTGRKMEL